MGATYSLYASISIHVVKFFFKDGSQILGGCYIHGKIQIDQSEGIYLPAKRARPNPKGIKEIWPHDLPIGEILSNMNSTHWANPI